MRTDDQVEVINKEHLIATLTDDVPFVLEMVVENGRGYVPASEHTPQAQEIGIIPRRRRLQPRGPRPLRDRGDPRRPEDELRQADDGDLDQRLGHTRRWPWSNRPRSSASTSIRSCSTTSWARWSMPRRGPSAPLALDPATEAKLNMSLAELELSVRATNCLESENITTVRDLVTRTESQLLEVRNFGETTLNEVREKLADIGPAPGHAAAADPRRLCRGRN